MAWEALCQPHVTPVNCRGLESSGGQSGKWGKGRSVAPAAAVRQGPREEGGRWPAGPETPTGRRLPVCRPPGKTAQSSWRPGLPLPSWSGALSGWRPRGGRLPALPLTGASAASGLASPREGFLGTEGQVRGGGLGGLVRVRPLRANCLSLRTGGRGSRRRHKDRAERGGRGSASAFPPSARPAHARP